MPTYEYVCKACDHRFEKRQSFSANPLRTCPECGEKQLQKVIFASGVVFKGSGFYVNDSKSSKSTSATTDTSSSSGSGEGSSSSNSSKSEPKSESKTTSKTDSASSSD